MSELCDCDEGQEEHDHCKDCDCILNCNESEFYCRWCEERRAKENPFIDCPECKDTDRQGKVTSEEFKWTGDMYEPFETWIDCENCKGLGEIERDWEDEDE